VGSRRNRSSRARRARNAMKRQRARQRWANGDRRRERGSNLIFQTRKGSFPIEFRFTGMRVPFNPHRPSESLRENHEALEAISEASETEDEN